MSARRDTLAGGNAVVDAGEARRISRPHFDRNQASIATSSRSRSIAASSRIRRRAA